MFDTRNTKNVSQQVKSMKEQTFTGSIETQSINFQYLPFVNCYMKRKLGKKNGNVHMGIFFRNYLVPLVLWGFSIYFVFFLCNVSLTSMIIFSYNWHVQKIANFLVLIFITIPLLLNKSIFIMSYFTKYLILFKK